MKYGKESWEKIKWKELAKTHFPNPINICYLIGGDFNGTVFLLEEIRYNETIKIPKPPELTIQDILDIETVIKPPQIIKYRHFSELNINIIRFVFYKPKEYKVEDFTSKDLSTFENFISTKFLFRPSQIRAINNVFLRKICKKTVSKEDNNNESQWKKLE